MSAASPHSAATVFVSGSRSIARLDTAASERLANILARRMRIVIGDAAGADSAVQHYLAKAGCRDVTVFCSGARCRNNIGAWDVARVNADGFTGRAFYTRKDKVMARRADYGFVLWDGRSAGSLANMRELIAQTKPVLSYRAGDRAFMTLRTATDLSRFLGA